jgi:hypothetical protein
MNSYAEALMSSAPCQTIARIGLMTVTPSKLRSLALNDAVESAARPFAVLTVGHQLRPNQGGIFIERQHSAREKVARPGQTAF